MRVTRRQFYPVLAAGLAYPAAEALWLEVNRRTVRLDGLRSPIRILHLSDLHFSRTVPLFAIDHAITMGLAGKPDLICVTGDFITRGRGFRYAKLRSRPQTALRICPDVCGSWEP